MVNIENADWESTVKNHVWEKQVTGLARGLTTVIEKMTNIDFIISL